MRTLFFISIVASIFFFACSDDESITPIHKEYTLDFDTVSLVRSPNDWILFSWESNNDWNYALVEDRTTEKTFEDIMSSAYIVSGKEQLMQLLDLLPEGETVIICCGDGINGLSEQGEEIVFDLPPADWLASLQSYSVEINIILFIEKDTSDF